MKTVIVYYSLGGNADYAAKRLAKILGAELLRLETVKPYPDKGFRKFFVGGRSAVLQASPKLKPCDFRPEDWDRVILGFPVWASNMAPPIRSFVKQNDLRGRRLAVFACQGGSGAEKAIVKLKALIGVEHLEASVILIDPKDRPSERTEAELLAFAEKLKAEGCAE
jgi:flavodoxin